MRRFIWVALLALMLAAVASAGCSTPLTLPWQNSAAAVVNGQTITTAAYQRQVELATNYLKRNGVDETTDDGKVMIDQMKQEVLSQMIDQELINQAAKKQGLSVDSAEVDKSLAEIVTELGGQSQLDAWLKTSLFTMDELRQTVREQLIVEKVFNKVAESVSTVSEQIHARHILVGTKEEADAVLARLAKGEDFAAVAADASLDDGSKADGGDLGFFPKGFMVPEFETAAFALQAGKTSEPIKTQFGYHIINVVERDPARPLDEQMLHANQQEAFATWIESQRKSAKIDMPGATPTK